jgi:hypothetical protein
MNRRNQSSKTERRNVLPSIFALFVSVVVGGCTTVHVSGPDGTVSRGIGVVNVHIPSNNKAPQLVTTEGFGLIAASKSLTVGFIRETVITFPDISACHVAIIVQSNTELEALQSILKDRPERFNNICIITKEGRTWPN